MPGDPKECRQHAVLSENHIRTYWWCSPARMGMVAMAPERWTARCKGASFPKPSGCRIGGKNSPQVRLAEDEYLIQALAAQCADQTFGTTILPPLQLAQ